MRKWLMAPVFCLCMIMFISCDNSLPTPPINKGEKASNHSPVEKNSISATVDIHTGQGHPMKEGYSGFNSRLAGVAWNFDNPQVREAFVKVHPGWVRFVAGTEADMFNWRTGFYEDQWVNQLQKGAEDAKVVAGKGGTKLAGFAEFIGAAGAKAILDINGFTDTPESAGDLAKFAVDNHIPVIAYELSNEPNFFMKDEQRYFNDPTDYADKMRPFAEAIRKADPLAVIALSYGWDGESFSKPLYTYPDKYWDAIAFHSYAIHADDKTVNQAIQRTLKSLPDKTSAKLMKSRLTGMPSETPALVTEFAEWNKAITSTMFADIYNAEYAMRMADHANMAYVGKMEDSPGFDTNHDYKKEAKAAAVQGKTLDNAKLIFGAETDKLWELLNTAFNNSDYSWDTTVSGGFDMPKNSGGKVPALFAKALKGVNGKNYVLLTNKSTQAHTVTVSMDGQAVKAELLKTALWAASPGSKEIEEQREASSNPVLVPPNSVVRLEWDSERKPAPPATTIYQAAVDGQDQVTLKWWLRETADGYKITVSAAGGDSQTIDAGNKAEYTIHGLEPGKSYTFTVAAYNGNGSSGPSNEVSTRIAAPDQPLIRNAYAKDRAVTVEWQSAANALGYRVCYGTAEAKTDNCRDAGNVAGYTVTGLTNGTPYHFAVKAYNGTGESASSDILTATPQHDLPYSARDVLADTSSNGKVSLKWLPSKTAPADRYIIERSTSPYSGYQPIANGVTGTSFTDSTAEPGRVYYYRLLGVNDQGTSAYPSNVATVKSSGSK